MQKSEQIDDLVLHMANRLIELGLKKDFEVRSKSQGGPVIRFEVRYLGADFDLAEAIIDSLEVEMIERLRQFSEESKIPVSPYIAWRIEMAKRRKRGGQ